MADDFLELRAQIQKALLTKTDLGGQAEWIDICSIEGDAYVDLPDGPIAIKKVLIHFEYDLTTGQITYQL